MSLNEIENFLDIPEVIRIHATDFVKLHNQIDVQNNYSCHSFIIEIFDLQICHVQYKFNFKN